MVAGIAVGIVEEKGADERGDAEDIEGSSLVSGKGGGGVSL